MKYNNHYYAVHSWLRRNYGKAHKCVDPNCQKRSSTYQWALKNGCEYERYVENFLQLCVPCHREYDGTNKVLHDAASKPVLVYKGEVLIGEYNSITEATKELKVSPSAVSNNLSGLSKTAGGYKWRYK